MSVGTIVVLGNGAAGAEKQALALAARLQRRLLLSASSPGGGVPIERVDATVRGVACALPPPMHVLAALVTRDAAFSYDRGSLLQSGALRAILSPRRSASERPAGGRSVVIGCGRATVALCALLKRRDPAGVFSVQVQHPRAPLAWFDAVVSPRHDFAAGLVPPPGNTLLTTGTVFDMPPALLGRHLQRWRPRLDELTRGRPRHVVWLVGGPCRGFPFTVGQAEAMAAHVAAAVAAAGASAALLVTFSRRTPPPVREVIRRRLAHELAGQGQLAVWDGSEADNPFYALLASAAAVLTTPDSVSMTTEAVAAGRPVLTLLADQASGKFAHFHRHMRDAGCTRPFGAEALAEALRSKDAQSTGSGREALEQEMAAVVDALVARL